MMKKTIILLPFFIFFSPQIILAQDLTMLYGKGTMWFMVDHGEASSARSAKLDGELNGDDIYWLRKLAGAKYGKDADETDIGTLEEIDMEGTRIVSGGEPYYFQGLYPSGASRIYPQRAKIYNRTDTIGTYMFMGCHRLKALTLPSSLKHISPHAFGNCDNLQIIRCTSTTPPGCSPYAFADKDNHGDVPKRLLERYQIIVPAGCEEAYMEAEGWNLFTDIREQGTGVYGDEFFLDGYTYRILSSEEVALTNSPEDVSGTIIIPSQVEHQGRLYTVTSIGANAFFLRKDVTSVQMPESIRCIGNMAFAHCFGLRKMTLPHEMESLGCGAFYGCPLTEMTIPQGIKTLPYHVLFECQRVKSLILPMGLERIGDEAFDALPLRTIELPSTLQYIGHRCFCTTSLEEVVCHVEIPIPLVGIPNDNNRGDGFNGFEFFAYKSFLSTVKLYVPDESIEVYRQANVWQEFDIHPMSEYVPAAIQRAESAQEDRPTAFYSLDGKAWPSLNRGVNIIKEGDETRKIAVP